MKKYLDETLSAEERAAALADELTTEEQAEQLRYDAPANERVGIPAYNWWNEGLHGLARAGVATVFPQAIGLAATFDAELIGRAAEVISLETRAKYNACSAHGDRDIYKGLTLWAPNINIFRDPRWGRGHETYGEDPFLTGELGKAFVRGIQGSGKTLRATACAKHFAVHSGPEALRHSFDAEVSPKELEETYLPAFEALVKDAAVEGVMGAYNRVNGEPACASSLLMEKLREWGFDGYFVSDCWAIQDFHQHHGVTSTPAESAALAIKTGCDVNCGCTYMNLMTALNEGLITESDIRQAFVHTMRTRFRLGMFDKKTEFDDIPFTVVSCDEHKKLALECAERSFVLLENNGFLPLDESRLKTIAVIGPNADSRAALEGNYNGLSDNYITFLAGIKERFGGRVIYAEGCHLYKDRMTGLAQFPGDRYAEALAAAECSDIIVLCVGLDATLEGEEGDTGNEYFSGDKNDLDLPESQRILINKILSVGKPVVIVTAAGSSVNVFTGICPENRKNLAALLHAWYPGEQGGKALAEILFGNISPSGKLPVTFYKSAAELPEFTDYSMKDRTYRFIAPDSRAAGNVLYPFGFGLTYGKAAVTGLEYSGGTARVTVTNSGRQTEEVVQLYIKDSSPQGVPNISLCGFKRVTLPENGTAAVEIPVPERAFTSVDDSGRRAVYGQSFTLFAGLDSRKLVSADITK